METIFKLFLTLNSLLLSFIVFSVKNGYIESFKLEVNRSYPAMKSLPLWGYYLAYTCGVFLLTVLSLWFVKYLGADSMEVGSIASVEPANDAFLPSYLGYFFVALSCPDFSSFLYVFSLVFIFIFFSKISYFNPAYFLLGYSFFYIVDSRKIKVLLITKKQLKEPETSSFDNLRRINNYTFIDMGKQ